MNTLGFLFESLVEHDLDIYASALGGKLYHYQDIIKEMKLMPSSNQKKTGVPLK